LEEKILTVLKERMVEGQRFILGIDGLSRSGKTTFTTKLKQHLQEKNIPIVIFHIDDYIVERKKRYNTSHEEWYEYYYLQWDLEGLTNNLFKQLKSSEILNLPTYDQHSDMHNLQVMKIPDTCLIIVEGVFLQRKEWRDYYDYAIYFDCPRQKRFKRESKETQQNIEKFRNRYWKAEDYYLETESPEKHADFVFRC